MQIQLRSLYDLTNEYNFVSTVSELSKRVSRSIGDNWVNLESAPPYGSFGSETRWFLPKFHHTCLYAGREAVMKIGPIPSSPRTASRSDNLARKPLISALKSWNVEHPHSSTSFYQLVLLFLKLYGYQENTQVYYSSEYYFALSHHHHHQDHDGSSRVLVVPFDSGHYVTITAGSSHGQITYITTDDDTSQAKKRMDEACKIYLQQSDELLGRTPGTTELLLLDGILVRKISTIMSKQLSQPELRQRLAIAVVGHCTTAMVSAKHMQFKNPLLPQAIKEMMTFLLSWGYKVRQEDLEDLFESQKDSQKMKCILGTAETGSQEGVTRNITDVTVTTFSRDLEAGTLETVSHKRITGGKILPEFSTDVEENED